MPKVRLADYRIASDSVPGWFYQEDVRVFEKLNRLQGKYRVTGDLLEIGCYQGKSAILLGYFPREDERFFVCDLFQTSGTAGDNRAEQDTWYSNLTRSAFEQAYLRFHTTLPVMLTCSSTTLLRAGRLSARTFRFIHVDGSHLYSIVRQDIRTAQHLLGPRGIVVFDDYRSVHTPGVAAAVWEEVARGGLIPLCLTPQKMYATWDARNRHLLGKLKGWAQRQGVFHVDTDRVCGRALLRIRLKTGLDTAAI